MTLTLATAYDSRGLDAAPLTGGSHIGWVARCAPAETHFPVMANIRPAQASDVSPLFELVRTFPTPTPPTAEQFSITLDAKLSDRSSYLLVAEHEGRLVG